MGQKWAKSIFDLCRCLVYIYRQWLLYIFVTMSVKNIDFEFLNFRFGRQRERKTVTISFSSFKSVRANPILKYFAYFVHLTRLDNSKIQKHKILFWSHVFVVTVVIASTVDVTNTGNGERGTGNGERGTGNGEPGTGNREPGTGVWETSVQRQPSWEFKMAVKTKEKARRETIWVKVSFHRLCPQMASSFL